MAELTFDQLSPEEKEDVVAFYNSQGQVPRLTWRDMVVATDDATETGTGLSESLRPVARPVDVGNDTVALTGNVYRQGDRDAGPNGDIRAAQTALSRLGASVGEVDGVYGRNTANAVQDAQEMLGLPRTGVLDQYTQDRFNSLTDDEIAFFTSETEAIAEEAERRDATTQEPVNQTLSQPTTPSQSVIQLKDEKTLKDYSAATTAGKRSLQDIEGIVLHHTHSSKPTSVDSFVSGGKDRGFGAPFFIDREGVVHQVAPLEEIIQHTSASKGTGVYRDPKGKRYSSANTIGIEVDAQWDYSADRLKEGPNEAQRNALNNLVNELLPQLNATREPDNQLNVDNSVFAHPELQAKKEEEATGLLNWLRVNNGFNEMRSIDRKGNVQVSSRPKARPASD